MPLMPLKDLVTSSEFEFGPVSDDAVRFEAGQGGYVWPSVDGDGVHSAVVLISAPGAMGKSAAGRALAGSSGFPHVDLSAVRVGSGTLRGLLGRALGMQHAGDYMDAVKLGRTGLILDGLDEAQLQAGVEHFFAFIQDVADLASGAVPLGQIVLLGRPDSIAGVKSVLEGRSVGVTELALMPLSWSAASDLIDSTLDATAYRLHRSARVPFGDLRDAVLDDLAVALTSDERPAEDQWPDVAEFLGYPPVLQALASRLAVSNPKSELERARQRGGKQRVSRGDLLVSVVEYILDRESRKVRDNLAGPLQFDESDSSLRALYTREEQVVRILARSGSRDMPVSVPASLSPAKRAIYEENVGGFVVDHPFLRERVIANVVFRDYLRAYVAASESIGSYGIPEPELVALCEAPGPFFAYFVHALTNSGTERGRVSEYLVDDLLRSFAAEDVVDRYAILSQLDGAMMMVLLYPDRAGASDRSDHSLWFDIVADSGIIELTSPLSRCVIGSDSGIVLHGRAGVFELGPSVVLTAADIELRAARLVAFGGGGSGDGGGVMLGFASISYPPKLQMVSYPDEALRVVGPDLSYPWSSFRISLPERAGVSPDLVREAVVSTRRILSAFGRSARDEPSRNREFIDNVIIGQSLAHKRVFDGLAHLGIVVTDGSLYRLELSRLADYGISYTALVGPNFEVALTPLVEQIINTPGFATD